MCPKIIINKGEKEIETIADFYNHFKPNQKGILTKAYNVCLCGVDIDDFFENKKTPYKRVDGEYFIGEIEEITVFDYEYKGD